jgi:hypothetical protein
MATTVVSLGPELSFPAMLDDLGARGVGGQCGARGHRGGYALGVGGGSLAHGVPAVSSGVVPSSSRGSSAPFARRDRASADHSSALGVFSSRAVEQQHRQQRQVPRCQLQRSQRLRRRQALEPPDQPWQHQHQFPDRVVGGHLH